MRDAKRVASVLMAAIFALGVLGTAGCKTKRKVKCDKICSKYGKCLGSQQQAEVKIKKDGTLKLKKKKGKNKYAKDYCMKLCKKRNKKGWKKKKAKKINKCLDKGSCLEITTCIMKHLY